MNYNIDTSQGMRNAVGWMEQMLGECRTPYADLDDPSIWGDLHDPHNREKLFQRRYG